MPIPSSLVTMVSRSRRTEGGVYSTPKTVLGFYAGVLAIVELGVVAAIGVLATQKELRHLVPWVLAFGAVILVLLIGVVVAINVKAPMKLQLGQVSGRDLIEYERMTLGDSIAGDYVEELPPTLRGGLSGGPPGLPKPPDDQDLEL